MEFIGYVYSQLVENIELLYRQNDHLVIRDDERIKLAIKIPTHNVNGLYALFLWDDFNLNDDRNWRYIENKASETIRFYQETIGVISRPYIFPEVNNIFMRSGVDIEPEECRYDNNHLSIRLSVVEVDNLWKVKIGNIITHIYNNANSATRVCSLIKVDIANYIRNRWCLRRND